MIPHGIEVLWDQRDALLSGFATTLVIAAVSAVCAGLLGLMLFALLISRNYNPIPPFLVALAIYLVVIGAFVATQRMLERRAGQFA